MFPYRSTACSFLRSFFLFFRCYLELCLFRCNGWMEKTGWGESVQNVGRDEGEREKDTERERERERERES